MLSDGYWGEEGLAWSPDGKEVLFSAGTGYTSFVIYGVTLAGARRVALQSAGGLTLHTVAPDGRWLVTRDDQSWGMMALVPGETAERDVSWLDLSEAVRLSRDGKQLLFSEESSAAGPNYAVCLRGTDGSPVVRLGEGRAGDLSPDAKWALGAIPTSPDQLMLYPTGAGEARRLDYAEIETYTTLLWFPDGKRLLLCGHESGRAERCFVGDLEGGALRPVTPEGTWKGVVSADGASVLAQSGSSGYFLYPVAGGAPRPVPALATNEDIALLTADGRSAYVFRNTDLPSRIERVDLETGKREEFKDIAPADRAGVLNLTNVTLSADERSYAYSYFRHLSHLFVVDGAR
jgi:Tol biopolymer transport system component